MSNVIFGTLILLVGWGGFAIAVWHACRCRRSVTTTPRIQHSLRRMKQHVR